MNDAATAADALRERQRERKSADRHENSIFWATKYSPRPGCWYCVLFTQCVSEKYITPKYTHQQHVWPQADDDRAEVVAARASTSGEGTVCPGAGWGEVYSAIQDEDAAVARHRCRVELHLVYIVKGGSCISLRRVVGCRSVCVQTRKWNNRNSVVCAFIPWPPATAISSPHLTFYALSSDNDRRQTTDDEVEVAKFQTERGVVSFAQWLLVRKEGRKREAQKDAAVYRWYRRWQWFGSRQSKFSVSVDQERQW